MNLFDVFVKFAVDDSAIDPAFKRTEKKAEGLGSKLARGLGTAAKVGMAAIGAATAAVGTIAKVSIDNYAEYEQLVGGVETLFKESTDRVMEYANDAYKTAGMSANDYMATVTSFSASLLQALGNDTEAAAEKANQAITDMADNANKMGTAIEMIQNAYQGFSKQNFTMLDNLKLGYGGTKEEMERLLADAERLTKIDYDISSYSDIVDAIHVIQTEMGITGTTAEEASQTIAGSVSAMKAAWQNFLTGMADPRSSFDQLLSGLVDSVVTVGNNVAPRIQALLPRLVDGLSALITGMLPYISGIVSQTLPSVVSAVQQIATGLLTMLPQFAAVGLDLIVAIATGIAGSLPELMPTIVDVVVQIGMMLIAPDNLAVLTGAALTLMIGLASGLIAAVGELIKAAPTIIGELKDSLIGNSPTIKAAGTDVIEQLINGLGENFMSLVDAGVDIIYKVEEGLQNAREIVMAAGQTIIDNVLQGMKNAWNNVVSWFKNAFANLTSGLSINVNGTVTQNAAYTGLEYVPYDNYPIIAHKGEAVLTKSEAEAWRKGEGVGNGNGGITIIQNIQTVPQTPVETAAATAAYFEQARWAFA